MSGIKTHLFETDWHIAEWNADVHVKYYWSDVDHWSGTSGEYVYLLQISVNIAMKVLASPCLLLASCLAQLLLMMVRRLVLMKSLSSWTSLRCVVSM